MHKLIAPIVAAALALGVAACGGSGSSNSSGSSTAPGSSGSATAGASATPTTSGSGYTGNTQTKVASQANQVLGQLALTTGQLANGKTSIPQARTQLRQLETQSKDLAKIAKTRLKPTSSERMLIVQIGNRGSAYAHKLQTMTLTPRNRQSLRQSQKALSNLETQTRDLAGHVKTPSLNQITSDLQTLQRQTA